MKSVVLGVLLLLMPVAASADWTKEDTAYQAAYTVLHLVDWSQTRWIANHPYTVHNFSSSSPDGSATFGRFKTENKESNPILGSHPSRKAVDVYFITTLAAHTAISYMLPDDYRRLWQCVTIGFEGGVVAKNISAGVKMSF